MDSGGHEDKLPKRMRRAAQIIYLLALGYAAWIGFYSVIPQVFAQPRPSETADDDAAISCARALDALHDDLWSLLDDAVTAKGERIRFADWDGAERRIRSRCADHPAHAPLLRLRYRAEHLIHRIADEEGSLAREIDRLIE